MAGTEQDLEELGYQQRLKAAVHYTVGQICDDAAEEKDVEFTKQFKAAVAETTFRYIQSVATDLEAFAKHARRSTINADDVKLLVRKSPQLHEHIAMQSQQLSTVNEEKKAKAKRRPKKSTASTTTTSVADDD